MAASPDQFRGHARLPHFAAPLRYDLRLHPDLAACTFTGAAAIAVVVSAPTRFLVLNAAELDVDRASIRFQACIRGPHLSIEALLILLTIFFFVLLQDLAPTDVAQFDEDEIMVISFDRELPFGEGVLTMDFTGTLNDQMRGFYRRYASSYCTSLLCMPYSNYS